SKFEYNGIEIITHKTRKFKTLTFLLTIGFPITTNLDKVTTRALLPYLLLEGTTAFPNKYLLQEQIENLYGTDIKIDLFKNRDTQLFSYYIEVPNSNYQSDSIKKLIDIFRSILFNSNIPNQLKNEQINNAKTLLKKEHNNLLSNKILYTNQKLIKKMHYQEPYAISAIGYKDRIKNVDKQDVLSSYKELVESSDIRVLLIGDINIKDNENIINSFERPTYNPGRLLNNNSIENCETKDPISNTGSQAYIAIGLKYIGDISKANIIKVANALLGRFPSSRLFQILREKEQLCYFVLSQIDMNTKNIIINLIVEKKEKNRAISIVNEELNNLKRGRFSEYELEKSKNAIRMLLLNAEDSPIGMMDDINQSIELKTNYDIKKQVEEINEINKQDVISIFNHWHLDTIYTLGDE